MKKRILVVSSANIDFVQRIDRLPYSGETIVDSEGSYSYVPGGKGANSALTFAKFGAECVFLCKIGTDTNGAKLKSLYENSGIDTRFMIEDPESPTGLASILVEKGGKNRIIVFPGANGNLHAEDVEDAFTSYPDALYLQFEIPDDAVIQACKLAREKDIPIFIDSAPARFDYPLKALGKVTIFSPNENECRIFTGITPANEDSALRAAMRLKNMVDAQYIVIKMGDKGAFMYDGSEYFVYPSEDVVPVDTTAAGDVFTAVMTYSYTQNQNIHSAIKMANIAAAISVTRPGASSSIPTLAEVMKYHEDVKATSDDEEAPEPEEGPATESTDEEW